MSLTKMVKKDFPVNLHVRWTNNTGSDVAVDQIVVVQGVCMFATEAIANGETGILIVGAAQVLYTAVTAETWTEFDPIFYDAGNDRLTNVANGNTFAGYAAKAKTNTQATGFVNLALAQNVGFPQVREAKTAVLDHASFTDGGAATGTIAAGITLPKGSIVLGRRVNVIEGFAGDTTAVIEIGDGSDADRFGPASDESVLNVADLFSGEVQGATGVNADTAVQVAVTGGADWGNITAGQVQITLFYLIPAA